MSNSLVFINQINFKWFLTKTTTKKFLFATIITSLFYLISPCGIVYSEETDITLKKPAKISVNKKMEGDKMDKTKWLSEEEGRYLLKFAKETIKNRLNKDEEPIIDWKNIPDTFAKRLGTFVTITIGGNLRGCIGHIIPRETLIEGIRDNAINAAFRDPRFPSLSKSEFNNIDLEVSILTSPEELAYEDAKDLLGKLRPGIDGVIIKKDFYEATFLPQVWDQLPDKEEFLSHLCMKAGLSADSWKKEKLHISTYQVQAFEEEKQ